MSRTASCTSSTGPRLCESQTSAPRLFKSNKVRQGAVQKVTALKHQKEMLLATKKFMLLVAGYASGKSHALHLCAMLDIAKYPGIKVLVLAPSYDLLRLNNVPALLELFEQWRIPYTFNKSEYIIHASNGAQVILRSMDNPHRIVAFEVARSYIDEADVPTLARMEETWNKTLGRTRQVVIDSRGEVVRNRVWAFSTPEGYKFCYKRWVKEGGAEYGIVRARTQDNPFIPSDFVESLRATYPANLIEAYLNGEFVNLTSGAVYYAFNRSVNDSDAAIEGKETLYIGMDFNVNKQMVVVFVRRVTAGQYTYHAVREFCSLRDTPDSVDVIKNNFPGHTIYIYPDATGRSTNTTSSGVSDHSLLRGAGFILKTAPANPLVKDRVAAVNGALEADLLAVNCDMCPELAAALEQQSYDTSGRPDKAAGLDHILDAMGYPICYLMPLTNRKAYLHMVAM